MNTEQLKNRRKSFIKSGEKLFMFIPDAWYDHPTWICCSGHVSTTILKSEEKGDLCLQCQQPAILTDPTDKGFNEN
jgi:hypothetical protein